MLGSRSSERRSERLIKFKWGNDSMTPEFEFHQRNRDLHPPVYTPIYKTSVLDRRASRFGRYKIRFRK